MNYKDRLLKMRVLMPTEKMIAAAKEKMSMPVSTLQLEHTQLCFLPFLLGKWNLKNFSVFIRRH